jgi:diphthine synthase
MFYLVGIGLKPEHITLEAIEALKKCDDIFLDAYTSTYAEGSIEQLEGIIGKKIITLKRKGVEEGFDLILRNLKARDVALVVFGNSLTATTHVQLLIDARRMGIKTTVLPGISLTNILGKTGLDEYKFGRTISIVFQEGNYAPESFYDLLIENKKSGLHTLCLLDIKAEENKMMPITEALKILEDIEKKRKLSLVKESRLIGLYGLGGKNEKIRPGNIAELMKSGPLVFPQALIVCGKLNSKEEEAIEALNG